ncbi:MULTISPECIES: hypothetical protein [unclassified Bradyrhizobium]
MTDLSTGSSALTGIFLYVMYKSETLTVLIVYQSLVYFFKSIVAMTAMSVVVAATINTAQAKLAPSPA